jgi:serine/threonine protein kinase
MTRVASANISDDFEIDDDYDVFDYKFVRKLGQGDSGEVVQMARDGQQYAVKICELRKRKPSFLRQSSSHDPREEAALLRNLNHPYVVKVYDFINDVDNNRLYIIMELLPGGTMGGIADAAHKRKVFGQLLTAVEYLHLHRLAHRDIKLENVMLDGAGRCRLCDFGISVRVPPGTDQIPSEMKGTPAYLAPEMLSTPTYDPFKADIWALGVLLFISMFGTLPFPAANVIMQGQAIMENEPAFPPDADPQLVDLLAELLCKDPARRMTIDSLWGHPWMQGVSPSLVSLILRVKEICLVLSKVQKTEAVTEVHRGVSRRRRPRPHHHETPGDPP